MYEVEITNYDIRKRRQKKNKACQKVLTLILSIFTIILSYKYYNLINKYNNENIIKKKNEDNTIGNIQKNQYIFNFDKELSAGVPFPSITIYDSSRPTIQTSSIDVQNLKLSSDIIDNAMEASSQIQQNNIQSSLLNKYNWVMYDTENKKNSITEDLILFTNEYCNEKGFNNMDLLFKIIQTESEGHADAVNKVSGAAGLGQFMESTGKYVYEDRLKLGVYDHNTTPLDPKTNIIMMVEYLQYLEQIYDGDIKLMLRQYCGARNNDEFANYYYNKVMNQGL